MRKIILRLSDLQKRKSWITIKGNQVDFTRDQIWAWWRTLSQIVMKKLTSEYYMTNFKSFLQPVLLRWLCDKDKQLTTLA